MKPIPSILALMLILAVTWAASPPASFQTVTLSTSGGGGGGGDTLWYSYTAMDSEGGTIYGTGSTNSLLPNAIAFAATYLTNFYGDFSAIISMGTYNPDPVALSQSENAGMIFMGDLAGLGINATNSWDAVSIGYSAGRAATLNNCTHFFNLGNSAGQLDGFTNSSGIFNLGYNSGFSLLGLRANYCFNFGDSSGGGYYEDTVDVFNYGHSSGTSVRLTNCGDIFNYGISAGSGTVGSNQHDIFNFGHGAGSADVLNDASDIYSLGNTANNSLVGDGLSHIFVIGSGGKATNSNDYVFGDIAYNYFFPGAKVSFSGGGGSEVASVQSDGSITTGGNTNRWSFGAQTAPLGTTNLVVTVNGQKYQVLAVPIP